MHHRGTGRLFFVSALAFLVAMVLFPALGTPAFAQEKEEKPSVDVPEVCKELGKFYKNKRNLDVDGITACIQILDEAYKDADKGGKGKIAKAIRKIFDVGPPLPDESLLKMAAGSLSGMGKDGKTALFYALNCKNLQVKNKRDVRLADRKIGIQAFIIESIGYNKDKSSVKDLCKLLWNKETPIIEAACKALGCYSKLPLKERKPLVKELVKVYANVNSLSVANPKRDDYRQNLLRLEVPFNEALRALTLQSIEDAVAWEKWYNKNKSKKRW